MRAINWYYHTQPSSAAVVEHFLGKPLPSAEIDFLRVEGGPGLLWAGAGFAQARPQWEGVTENVTEPSRWKEPWKYGVAPLWPLFAQATAIYLLDDEQWETAKEWVERLTLEIHYLQDEYLTRPERAALDEDFSRTFRFRKWIEQSAPEHLRKRFLDREATLSTNNTPTPEEEE